MGVKRNPAPPTQNAMYVANLSFLNYEMSQFLEIRTYISGCFKTLLKGYPFGGIRDAHKCIECALLVFAKS